MANSPGFRTVATFIPDALASRLTAYLKVKGGTTSGFIKNAITASLGDIQAPDEGGLPVALSDVQKVVAKFRSTTAACTGMSPDKALAALESLESELVSAHASFQVVAAANPKYDGAYKQVITSVRNKLRAARTKAVTSATPDQAPARAYKEIPKWVNPPSPESMYEVEAEEFEALGLPASLKIENIHLTDAEEKQIKCNVTWLRGGVSVGSEPTVLSDKGDACVKHFIEVHRALIAENHKYAKPANLAYYEALQARMAALRAAQDPQP